MKITDVELKVVVDECREELKKIGIDVPDAMVGPSYRSTRSYGKCTYHRSRRGSGSLVIRFNEKLYDGTCKSDLPLRNTIIHELLHCVDPSDQHGKVWKALAAKVNRYYPKYDIARMNDYSKYGLDISKPIKIEKCYVLQCKKCGRKFIRQRYCKVVRNCYDFRCGACKGDLALIQTPNHVQILRVHTA